MKQIKETAYAKINLGLDILGKREDGYHEVSMIMQSVGLSDEVVISKGNGIQISCNLHNLSCGPDNLGLQSSRSARRSLRYYSERSHRLEQKNFSGGRTGRRQQ